MSDPTQAMPAAEGPGGPDGPNGPGGPGGAGPGEPMDRRKVAIGVVIGIIVLLLILLAVVALGDDDGDNVATTSTTTESTTTTEAPSTTDASTTTTEAPTTSTTGATTTTLAAPQETVPPDRCTGQTDPDAPEPVAIVFYDAWRVGDRACAEEVASQDAIDTLFANDGAGAQWEFQGCFESDDPEPKMDCAHTYPGGSAHFEMHYGAIAGWQVVSVDFVAD